MGMQIRPDLLDGIPVAIVNEEMIREIGLLGTGSLTGDTRLHLLERTTVTLETGSGTMNGGDSCIVV